MWEMTVLKILFSSLLFHFSLSETVKKDEVIFDQANVAVLLNPEVAPLGYEADNARTTSDICREDDIFPLLEKIRERFSIVAFKTTNSKDIHKISYDCLPSAVAKLNQRWVSMDVPPMKAWLVDSVAPVYVQTDTDFTSRLNNLSTVVTEANTLFPGTVPIVFLDYYSYIHDGEDSQAKENAEKHLSSSLKLFGENVKTGLVLSNSYCEHLERNIKKGNNMISFISKANVVLFADFEPGLPSVSVTPENYTRRTYTKCADSIEPTFGKDTHIGVYTAWPTTTPTGLTSYSYFVGVWKALNAWAKEKQKPVLMWGAFDDLARANIPWSSLGWWRLLPRSDYVNTSDYQFIEKTQLVEVSGKPTGPMQTSSLVYGNSSAKFSREYFGVEFNPFVHLFENGVQGRQVPVHSLVRQVSTHFSRFRVPTIQEKEVHHSIAQLLKAVPKFNSNASIPLELVMTFGVENVESGKIAFDTTAALVSQANGEFPGTVKLILLDALSSSSCRRVSNVHLENVLGYAKRRLPKNTSLGMIVSVDPLKYKVDEENFNRTLAPLLKHITSLYLNAYIPPERLHLGVDRVVPDITSFFEKFKKHLQTKTGGLAEVGFITNWHDADGHGKQNYFQLANFWEKLNNWAERTKSNVIMKEAFDNPSGGKDSTRGWWRLVQNKTVDNENDDVLLEEKRSVLAKPMVTSGETCKCWSPYN